MITYSAPKPLRLHLGTLASGMLYLAPEFYGASAEGGTVSGSFPDFTAITQSNWVSYVAAHNPVQTDDEERAAKIAAQAQALTDYSAEFPTVSRAELEARIGAITDLASAKVFLKKLSLAVLWLLRQNGK